MAFDLTQPYASVEGADGFQAYLQSGTLWSRNPPYGAVTLTSYAGQYNSVTVAISAASFATASPPIAAGYLLVDPVTKVPYGFSNGTNSPTAVGVAPQPFTETTWAARGTPTSGNIKLVTDVGPVPWLARGDGTNWLALGGRFVLAQLPGSIAAPYATVTGSTGANFTLSGGAITVPAGLLRVGSQMFIEGLVNKRGVNGAATFRIRIGTTGTFNTDAQAYAVVLPTSPDSQQATVDIRCIFSASGFTTTYQSGRNAQFTALFQDVTGNVSLSTAMIVAPMFNNGNVADNIDLIGFTVMVQQ